MSLFIETIRLTDGRLSGLRFHNRRLNETRKIHFGSELEWDLAQLIEIPEETKNDLYKCRVVYGENLEKIEFELYHPKIVQSLKLIEGDKIDYAFKYQNRTQLNTLFAQRGMADDVLIVKNGNITDTSYANIAFWEGKEWHTPQTPLLAGTKRAQLLEEGVIVPKKIRAQDLPKYAYARVLNAMLDFETTPNILIENIFVMLRHL